MFTVIEEPTSSSDDDSAASLDIHKERNRLHALDNAREDNQDIISMAPLNNKKRRKAERIIMKPILAEAAAIQSRIHDAAIAATNASSSATVVQQQPKQRTKTKTSTGKPKQNNNARQQQQQQQQEQQQPPPPPLSQNTFLAVPAAAAVTSSAIAPAVSLLAGAIAVGEMPLAVVAVTSDVVAGVSLSSDANGASVPPATVVTSASVPAVSSHHPASTTSGTSVPPARTTVISSAMIAPVVSSAAAMTGIAPSAAAAVTSSASAPGVSYHPISASSGASATNMHSLVATTTTAALITSSSTPASSGVAPRTAGSSGNNHVDNSLVVASNGGASLAVNTAASGSIVPSLSLPPPQPIAGRVGLNLVTTSSDASVTASSAASGISPPPPPAASLSTSSSAPASSCAAPSATGSGNPADNSPAAASNGEPGGLTAANTTATAGILQLHMQRLKFIVPLPPPQSVGGGVGSNVVTSSEAIVTASSAVSGTPPPPSAAMGPIISSSTAPASSSTAPMSTEAGSGNPADNSPAAASNGGEGVAAPAEKGGDQDSSDDSVNNGSVVNSVRTVFTNPLGYRTEDDERVFLDGPYDFSDVYQGVHPDHRGAPQPHTFYPTARVFENLSTYSFRLIWKISEFSRIVEDLEQHQLHALKHSSPKLLWLQDTYEVPGSLKSLFPAVVSTTAANTTVIDLSTPSTALEVVDVDTIDANVNDDSTGNDANSIMRHDITAISASPSVNRIAFEKSWYKELKKLYQPKSEKSSVKLDVGGRGVIFQSFHYIDDENDSVSISTKTKKFEYVDALDDTLLYRWEMKGCLAVVLGTGKKAVERLFFALCRYQPNDPSSSMREFDCLAILVTRCSTRQPMFIMRDVGKQSALLEEWKGWDQIKHYHAAPEVTLPFDLLKEQRHVHFECNRYLYRKDKSILIDTHKPGAITELNSRSDLVEKKERFWAIKAGLRPAFEVESPYSLSGCKRGRGSSDDTSMRDDTPSSEAPDSVASKKGKVNDSGTSVISINKLQSDLKKSEDKVASLQRKIDKLEGAQSESSKLKTELATLKRRNAQLQAENAQLSSETRNYYAADSPSNEKILANIQKQVQEIARSASSIAQPSSSNISSRGGSGSGNHSRSSNTGISGTSEYGDDVMLSEVTKRLRNTVQVEQLQLELQNIRESKVRSRARQSETELMQLHRQQVLDDKAFQRYDEDRNFYREMYRQDAEHRHGREKTRDIIALTAAANDPYNLQQLLAQQNRTIATPHHQVVQSPVLQVLAQLLGSPPPPPPSYSSPAAVTAESPRVTAEPATNTPVVDSPITPMVDQRLPPRLLLPTPTPPPPTNNNNSAVSRPPAPQQTIGIADRQNYEEDGSDDSDSDQPPMTVEELKLRVEKEKLKIADNLALQETLKK